MQWRFRKKILPGLTVSVGKKGTGVRVGPRIVGLSSGPSGKRITGGIPGTGLFYSHKLRNDRAVHTETPERSFGARFWLIAIALSALAALVIVSTQ